MEKPVMMCADCHKMLQGRTWKAGLQKLSSNFEDLTGTPKLAMAGEGRYFLLNINWK